MRHGVSRTFVCSILQGLHELRSLILLSSINLAGDVHQRERSSLLLDLPREYGHLDLAVGRFRPEDVPERNEDLPPFRFTGTERVESDVQASRIEILTVARSRHVQRRVCENECRWPVSGGLAADGEHLHRLCWVYCDCHRTRATHPCER